MFQGYTEQCPHSLIMKVPISETACFGPRWADFVQTKRKRLISAEALAVSQGNL